MAIYIFLSHVYNLIINLLKSGIFLLETQSLFGGSTVALGGAGPTSRNLADQLPGCWQNQDEEGTIQRPLPVDFFFFEAGAHKTPWPQKLSQ